MKIKAPAAILALALAATTAHAEFWIGTASTGNWSTASNWSATNGGVTNNTLPPAGDFVNILFNDSVVHTVSYDVTTNLTYGEILLNQTGSGNLVFQKNAGTNLFVNDLDVGTSGKGVFSNPSGNTTINTYLRIAETSGSTASAAFGGGTINFAAGAQFQVALFGTGTVSQTGANVNANTIDISPNAGAVGVYNLGSGTLVVNGDLNVGGRNGGTATFNLAGGSLNMSGNVIISTISTFNFSSGTLAGNVINNHNFSQTGGNLGNGLQPYTFTNNGTFTGTSATGEAVFDSFINNGTISVDDTFVFAGGFTNFSNVSYTAGHTFTVANAPFENDQLFALSGATLESDFNFINNATFTASGNITGTGGFSNNGNFSLTGAVNLNNTNALGPGFNLNNGNLDVSSFQFRLNGAPFTNNGSITIAGGTISGAKSFTNSNTGTLSGSGLISTTFSNLGTIFVPSGLLNITNNFTSSGTIQFGGPTANLIGGAITNNGNIIGNGTLGNNITNNSTIDPTGGTLILTGLLTNPGTLSASTGNKLLTKNFNVNPGIISLSGGTFDNGNNPLNNTGEISGYGILNSGGITNNGTFTLTGGTTTVNGNVTNAAGKIILAEFNPVIFTGRVTNNGIFKSTSTTITFAGPYTENGTFLSDPATQTFSDVDISSTGAWQGGKGDKFILTGHFISHSTASSVWNTDQAEIAFQGATSHTITLSGTPTGGFNNNFSWGTLTLALGDSLTLQNGDAPNDTALFIHDLNLPGGLSQLASISGQPGQKIFYDESNPANAYLNNQNFTLSGGAQLLAVPEPTTLLLVAPLALLRRRKQK